MSDKIKLPFLCTENSCHSQMGEGWMHHLKSKQIDVWSAGVDISDHQSTHIRDIPDIPFDYLRTTCDHARESFPLFPRPVKKIQKSIDDPPYLTESKKTDKAALWHYCRVRDEIRAFVETLPKSLKAVEGA